MATQRLLLLTLGGKVAELVWQKVLRWSAARTALADDEWTSEDWPTFTKHEIDRFVALLAGSAFTPPVLYRSEHVDCWSMGDVFVTALMRSQPNVCRRLITDAHEITASWGQPSRQIVPTNAPPETQWLNARINEAVAAWGKMAETRLLLLIRTVIEGLWTDEEVAQALHGIPAWWSDVEL